MAPGFPNYVLIAANLNAILTQDESPPYPAKATSILPVERAPSCNPNL